jgi:hypothetical protein
VNLEPLRRLQSKLTVAFVAAAALSLTSCGGGGASGSPTAGGALQLLPGTASIYAGVPYTFNIAGGHGPYLVTSSEPTLVPLNFTTSSNEFEIVARNPGVVDVGLDPAEVPRRTVNIEVRDSVGASVTNSYNVLQNFFTGYGESYASTCSVTGTAATPPQACSGTDSLVTLTPVSNGTLYGDRQFQFDKVRGDFQFVMDDPAAVPQLVNQLRKSTDHDGRVVVRLRVNVNAPTQLAQYKVTDILTGATIEAVFLIVQQPVSDAISVLPDTLTFTGGLSTQCGTGSGDVFVFGGTPPYTVTAPAGISVSPTLVTDSGGHFTISVGAGGFSPTSASCPPSSSVIVTDSRGATGIVTVNVEVGTGTAPTLAVAPTTIASLLCGQSVQVTVVGGTGTYSASSQHPRIVTSVVGNVVTLTRLQADPLLAYPASGSVVITDGASTATVAVSATPAFCP